MWWPELAWVVVRCRGVECCCAMKCSEVRWVGVLCGEVEEWNVVK